MIKLMTQVDCGQSLARISLSDSILTVGSCFAAGIGEKLSDAGFDVCVNPFGTLYNPVSVHNALLRLENAIPFTLGDCVPMGAGAGKICSFSHHTSFAREKAEDFLAVANSSLREASAFYRRCDRILVTLGTSWCFKRDGEVVSNCLKRPAGEFSREFLPMETTLALLRRMVGRETPEGVVPKQFIFTVSPIRHPADGAHGNQVSKSALLLAVEAVCREFPGRAEYFPAYEIMMDELRDYRYYADDLVHPSDLAVRYIWEKFVDFAVPPGEHERLREAERQSRRSRHRPLAEEVVTDGAEAHNK